MIVKSVIIHITWYLNEVPQTFHAARRFVLKHNFILGFTMQWKSDLVFSQSLSVLRN